MNAPIVVERERVFFGSDYALLVRNLSKEEARSWKYAAAEIRFGVGFGGSGSPQRARTRVLHREILHYFYLINLSRLMGKEARIVTRSLRISFQE